MSGPRAPARTRFITHEGVRMLLLDFSGIRDVSIAHAAIAEARALIAQQPLSSLLTITHIKGAVFAPSIVVGLQELAKHDKPYVRAAVVSGMSSLQRLAFHAIRLFSNRSFHTTRDVEEAKSWLAAWAKDHPA